MDFIKYAFQSFSYIILIILSIICSWTTYQVDKTKMIKDIAALQKKQENYKNNYREILSQLKNINYSLNKSDVFQRVTAVKIDNINHKVYQISDYMDTLRKEIKVLAETKMNTTDFWRIHNNTSRVSYEPRHSYEVP